MRDARFPASDRDADAHADPATADSNQDQDQDTPTPVPPTTTRTPSRTPTRVPTHPGGGGGCIRWPILRPRCSGWPGTSITWARGSGAADPNRQGGERPVHHPEEPAPRGRRPGARVWCWSCGTRASIRPTKLHAPAPSAPDFHPADRRRARDDAFRLGRDPHPHVGKRHIRGAHPGGRRPREPGPLQAALGNDCWISVHQRRHHPRRPRWDRGRGRSTAPARGSCTLPGCSGISTAPVGRRESCDPGHREQPLGSTTLVWKGRISSPQ